MSIHNHNLDVLVIGAGQAGLAMGFYLKQTSLRFLLIDGNARIGDSWRNRYDSLTLFTPRRYSALPGLALSGDPWEYATKDDFAAYLASYAEHFDLPVMMDTPIRRLDHRNGHFYATTASGDTIEARSVILATGGFQRTAIPAVAQHFSPEVKQFSPENYKNSAQIPPGTVLVVGDGASGRDIASDLAATHNVLLATGRARRVLPERILGKSVWWWLDKLGILDLPAATILGRFIRKADPFPGRGKKRKQLQQSGIRIVGRLTDVKGKTVTLAGGMIAEVDAIIWATGYRDDADWVGIPEVKDNQGNFIHRYGISTIPGLYFLGRPWQRNRASALVTGVGKDAAYILEQIVRSIADSAAEGAAGQTSSRAAF